MSSLLQQLRQRKEQQKGIFLPAFYERASLLFDSKAAANVDAHSILLLAHDGLEQLNQLDPRIGGYREALFSRADTEYFRASLDPPEEKATNKKIKKFLPLLAPHFLLSSTHKVLEHLIRKYLYVSFFFFTNDLPFSSIHIFNAKELLMICLPFHETLIFAKVLSIVELK